MVCKNLLTDFCAKTYLLRIFDHDRYSYHCALSQVDGLGGIYFHGHLPISFMAQQKNIWFLETYGMWKEWHF